MRYYIKFLDYGWMFAISGELLRRRQGFRTYVKHQGRIQPRRVLWLKRRLKESFPWKHPRRMKFNSRRMGDGRKN
jgi:hypothetical protein